MEAKSLENSLVLKKNEKLSCCFKWLLSVVVRSSNSLILLSRFFIFTLNEEGKINKQHTGEESHLRFVRDHYFMCVLIEGSSSCLKVTIPGLTKLDSWFSLNTVVILPSK